MTYYGGKELAASFRTVRSNTIKVAEEIPEDKYGFQAAPDVRTVGKLLMHIGIGPTFSLQIQGNKVTDLKTVKFQELMQTVMAEEAKPRTKAEIIAYLKSEGEKFASFLEGLSDAFLAEPVTMMPGNDPATKSRFEMLMSTKEHEMHHRGQLMLIERMIGVVPHLTRQMQERMAQHQAQAARVAPPMSAPRFSDKSLRFLRALKRNNRREWFAAHRDDYETYVREPMTAVVSQLADDLRSFAPEIIASPKSSMYRIYRDIRFSENKAPYKTHVAASFPTRGLAKHEGAGLYFHVSPEEVWIGGGMYAPSAAQLHEVRAHIATNFRRLRTLVESPTFRREIGHLEGERLLRVPRGFAKDHPAAEYLKFRQFLAGRDLPATTATSPRFYGTLVATFKRLTPLMRFLNEPLVKHPSPLAEKR